MDTGVLHVGPWRLAMESASPCAVGRRRRRSGAMLGCRRVDAGRSRKNSEPPSRAARCRRRSAAAGTRLAQHSSIARLSWRRICSAAHSASSAERGAISSSRRQSICQLTQQWMQGSPGGCTSTMCRSVSWFMAGRSRLTSPMPGWSYASSVSDPTGQPWPGSSRSSWAKPVETVACWGVWKLLARQRAGCMLSGRMRPARERLGERAGAQALP